MFHYTGAELDTASWQWKPLGEDLARVNEQIAPLGPELLKLGNPAAVYSTPITRTEKDDALADTPMPHPELPAIPGDFWLHVDAGEALFGVFRDELGRDALVFANHNAYQPQAMALRCNATVKRIEQFDRNASKWIELPIADGQAKFALPSASAELVRFER